MKNLFQSAVVKTMLLFPLWCGLCNVLNAADVYRCAEPSIEHIVVEPGITIFDLLPFDGRQYSQFDIDPGYFPEGDYLGWPVFTRDGQRVLVTNRTTGNVTVFDWTTMDVLANIDVGDYPNYLAVTDSQTIISCAFSDDIYVLNLNTYAIDTTYTVPAGQQPWVIRLSPDDVKAYVACDISNTVEVFNLETGNHELTISDFPIGLSSFGFNSENGRNTVTFSNFEITPDGMYLIVGDWDDSLYFFNTTTGAIDHAIGGVGNVRFVALSGDSTTAVVFAVGADPALVYQVDLSSYTVTSSVTVTGHSISMAYEIGVNYDGSKAFIGISGNESAIVRFDTQDFVTFSSTYTPFWIGTSPDHSLAISGQYRFSIIDFTSETVLGQYVGNSQYNGSVSPVDTRALGFDAYRHEGVYFYDYTNTASPTYRGTTESGLTPEGDAPRRIAITPDGSKAIVANVLSDNIAIIDLNTHVVDTIIENGGDRVQNVAVTSDGQWAVACGMNANTLKVIDLTTNEIVADVYTGTRPGVVSISPDDSLAYVGNISANTVSVVRLQGTTSYKITDISCGAIGVVWACFGVLSDVEVTPDGEYCLVAASFDDQVQVIDTETNAIVSTLSVGDFPIQIAFDSSSYYATVTNVFSDNVTILYVDGASSYVAGTFPLGDYPLRLSYNEAYDEIGVGHYNAKTVVNIDPSTGGVLSTDYYTSYGNLIQVLFDEAGEPIVLSGSTSNSPGHLHHGTDVIELPATPSFFDYCPAVQKTVVVMPGPDYVTVVDWSGINEVVTIPLTGTRMLKASPSPFTNEARIEFAISHDEHITLAIYDCDGRRVKTLADREFSAGIHTVLWNASNEEGKEISTGVYYARIEAGSYSCTRKIVYMK